MIIGYPKGCRKPPLILCILTLFGFRHPCLPSIIWSSRLEPLFAETQTDRLKVSGNLRIVRSLIAFCGLVIDFGYIYKATLADLFDMTSKRIQKCLRSQSQINTSRPDDAGRTRRRKVRQWHHP